MRSARRPRTRPARQPPAIPPALVPRHVAIVMDGNGRWAKQRGLPRTAGHEQGEHSLFDVVEGAIEIGVKAISAYAFSTENWTRSPDEVRFLMGFNRDVIRRRRDEMHELGVRVRWAGRAPRLWRSVIKELQVAEELTRDNDVLTLTMCVNYGGRAELADAARSIAREVAAGRLNPDKVDERTFAKHLYVPELPGRRPGLAHVGGAAALATSCSGRRRTPRWSSPTCSGPTSTAAHLWRAIEIYAGRDRRYGARSRTPDPAGRQQSGQRQAAVRAGPEDLQGVADVGEAVLAGDRVGPPLDRRALDLDGARRRRGRPGGGGGCARAAAVDRLAVLGAQHVDLAGVGERLQGAVDGGQPDVARRCARSRSWISCALRKSSKLGQRGGDRAPLPGRPGALRQRAAQCSS